MTAERDTLAALLHDTLLHNGIGGVDDALAKMACEQNFYRLELFYTVQEKTETGTWHASQHEPGQTGLCCASGVYAGCD